MKLIQEQRQWFVETGTERVGPFPHRGKAVDWILEQTETAARRAREQAAALTDADLARVLEDAIANPPRAPRGRPVPDHPREADIAFEYYWRIRQGTHSQHAVTAIAKEFGCSPDHVRKISHEYDPVADYDDRLLEQLRADSVQRRESTPTAKSSPPAAAQTAAQWLRTLLRDAPMPPREIARRGRMAGYSLRTLERAKDELGIVSARKGRGWVWSLPSVKPAKSRI